MKLPHQWVLPSCLKKGLKVDVPVACDQTRLWSWKYLVILAWGMPVPLGPISSHLSSGAGSWLMLIFWVVLWSWTEMLTERMRTGSKDWGQYSREDLCGLEGSSVKNFRKIIKIEKTIKRRVNYVSRINENYSHNSHICEWGMPLY